MKNLILPFVCTIVLFILSSSHPAPIVNRLTIDISQTPYQILIDGGANGGGSIVAPGWIVTAAHLLNINAGKAGVSIRSESGQSLQIGTVFRPENFQEQLTGQSITYPAT